MGKWDRLLSESRILVGMKARRNFDAIRELVELLAGDGAIPDPKDFLARLIQREKGLSSGIGKGVAVPHLHDDSIPRQILAVGTSAAGIPFGSLDGEPVHIVALLATPNKHHEQHMELLASLSRLLQQDEARQALIQAVDVAAVLQVFGGMGADG
jgi:mannitol/fructose-specific phosphotransferase system IIA component (Ntr-type)